VILEEKAGEESPGEGQEKGARESKERKLRSLTRATLEEEKPQVGEETMRGEGRLGSS